MKKAAVTLSLIIGFALMFCNDASAQRYDEAKYNYADASSGVIYQLYLKFNGYQVQVWMKNSQATEWSTCQVVSSDDEVISVKLGATAYNLALDENNEDVIIVYSGDYSQKWRYLKE